MKSARLIALVLTIFLLAAGPAAATTIKVVSLGPAKVKGPAPSVVPGEGGGYAGCWRAYVEASGSHWTGSTWRHHFNPAWCGNGYVITHVDAGWHYQTTTGFYGPNGVSRWVISGCVGCPSIRFHAQARFSFNFWGWTSYFNNDQYITLYASNGRIGG